jgi:hypothetical protein
VEAIGRVIFGGAMKPAPAPDVAGNTPWERLDSAVRQIFTVSKEAVVQSEAAAKRKRIKAKKKAASKP